MKAWYLRIPVLVLAVLLTATATAQAKKSGAVVNDLIARAASDGTVRVIVQLDTNSLMIAPSNGAALSRSQRIQRAAEGVLNRVNAAGKRSVKRFKHLPFITLETTPQGLREVLASPESLAVFEDRLLRPTLDDSVPLIGGDVAAGAGFTGIGQAVAVVDTGVDRDHPFLAPRVVSEACYSSTVPVQSASTVCPDGSQSQTGAGAGTPCLVDGCDHGTHVAGIAAGSGATFDGVALAADIIAIQVFSRFDSTGSCGSAGTPCVLAFTSDIMLGLERVYELRSTFNIASVNMSLGGGFFPSACDTDPMKVSIDLLRGAGIATAIASGNNGYTNAVGSPACISTAVAVGSTTKFDTVSSFSNSSTLVDLLAPGSAIRSSVPGGGFAVLSGTSMATPHVAGAFAALRSASPTATVDDMLAALTSTGVPITDNRNGLVKPRIQLDAAISALGTGGGTQIQVTPQAGLAAAGLEGGPFAPSSIDYTITNSGSSVLDFVVATSESWVTLTPGGGSLGAGENTTVTVAIGPEADLLTRGAYSTTVRFSDQSGSSGTVQRTVDLTVSGPGVTNDKFSDAVLLAAANGLTAGSNVGASKEPGEPDHGNDSGGASVWWQWIAPAAGTLTVDTFGSNFDTTLGIYQGNNVATLTSLAQNNNAPGGGTQSEAQIDVAFGETYYLAVDGSDAQNGIATGDITLNWTFDNSGVGIEALSVTPQEGFAATGDVGGPFTPTSKTYTLTNTSASTVAYSVVTNDNFFDASSSGGQLQPGSSSTLVVSLNANANTLAAGTTAGSFSVNGINRSVTVTATTAGISNDDFADALDIPDTLPVTLGATNEGATVEPGEPVHAGNVGGASVWWTWTAPEDGTAVIETTGSNFDTLLAVYQGTAVNSLTPVAANDDSGSLQSRVSFDVTAGATFRIAVDGYNAATGSISLKLALADAVRGDAFADAVAITGTSQNTNSITASVEPGEPFHAGDAGGHSVWWTWTALADETITIDTFGSNFDTLLAVYTGQQVDALTEVAANDDVDLSSANLLSRVSFDAISGQTYHIAVDGFGGASGAVTLNFQGGVFTVQLFASILPTSRSVVTGTLASVFASISNGSPEAATGCRIELLNTLPVTFNYRTTDPATNLPDGGPVNPVVTIPSGGFQSYIFELTPSLAFPAVDTQFSYVCDNVGPATVSSGLNTMLLAASNNPTADVIALASTATQLATVIAGPGTAGAFAIATFNVGAGDSINVAPSASDPNLQVSLSICETNPSDGQCLAPPGGSVTTTMASGAAQTFSIFVTATEAIPFLPADNRIRVVFSDQLGNVRGATSVAVTSALP